MPRYFFHLFDDVDTMDEQGTVLPDLAAVRVTALENARALICDCIHKGYVNLDHRIEVEDEAGDVVLVQTFGDTFKIERTLRWRPRT